MSESMMDRARGMGRILPSPSVAVAWALTAFVGLMSVVDIEPGQAAVRVNNLSGHQVAVTQPGWTVRIPMLHSVYVLDGAPQTFSMKGGENVDDLNVMELTVRASDGSNFHFEDTTLIFRLIGTEAVAAVNDSGPHDAYMHWVKPYARSILREEFGRETTIDVSDPTTYAQATHRAKTRLNEVLKRHGLMVTQLVTPRPRFNDLYEQAIEERNALGNQEQVIKSDLDRAETQRSRRMAVVDQEQNRVIQEQQAALESDLAQALAQRAITKRGADTYAIGRVADGQASLSAAQSRAVELQGELDAKYSARKAEIDAFRGQPIQRVMARLGERLQNVTIHIKPYADDATPSRVRYEEVKP